MNELLIFPSDERQEFLKSHLEDFGYNCKMFSQSSQLSTADIVVLPIPSIADGMIKSNNMSTELFTSLVARDCTVIGFCIKNTSFYNSLLSKGIRCFDGYDRPELAVSNAYATAQGVLKFILCDTKKMMRKNSVLISGYGKTGKAICDILADNNVDVSVLVRRAEYKSVLCEKNMKCYFYDEVSNFKNHYDYLINTVDSKVITKEIIDILPENCKILEIASKPYGIDFSQAEKRKIEVKILPSLPSKAAPDSAGEFLAQAVRNIIEEENLWSL